MAADWSVRTLLVDEADYITKVIWEATDTVDGKTGVEAGAFMPDADHPLRQNTYENFNEQQIIAHVKASLGGLMVAYIEKSAAIARSKKRMPVENRAQNNRRDV